MVCAYDTAKFQELGLQVPQSYQELAETAAALKADGSGIALPAAQANGAYTVWSQLLYSAGGYPVADGSLAINSEECVNAAKRYQELVSYACEGSLGWGNEGVVAALQSGNASLGVMMSGNNGYLHDPSASAITETVSYFPFYGYEDQASANQTYWVWAIPANCTNPQAAMEFISWACSQEMERQQTLETLAISGISALAQEEDILKAVPFADIGRIFTVPPYTSVLHLSEPFVYIAGSFTYGFCKQFLVHEPFLKTLLGNFLPNGNM